MVTADRIPVPFTTAAIALAISYLTAWEPITATLLGFVAGAILTYSAVTSRGKPTELICPACGTPLDLLTNKLVRAERRAENESKRGQ